MLRSRPRPPVHAAEFEQDGCKVFRGRLRNDLPDKGAAGEENEVKRKLQEFGFCSLPPAPWYGAGSKYFGTRSSSNLGRFRECFAQRENTGVSGRERRQRRTDQQEQGPLKGPM